MEIHKAQVILYSPYMCVRLCVCVCELNFNLLVPLSGLFVTFSLLICLYLCILYYLGYGSLTPKTVEGKIVTMAYAMIGVPLMLMCLSNLGRVLAESVRQTYARLCIRQSDHYKCNGDDGVNGISGNGGNGINGTADNGRHGGCMDGNSVDAHDNSYHLANEKIEVIYFAIFSILFSSFFFSLHFTQE